MSNKNCSEGLIVRSQNSTIAIPILTTMFIDSAMAPASTTEAIQKAYQIPPLEIQTVPHQLQKLKHNNRRQFIKKMCTSEVGTYPYSIVDQLEM